ncbi:MAG: hypothetical protein JWP47_262 [Polaromonas sp.]|jgi:two-component system sensor histidine kinase QseC|nr:hypothetical protein [Polaromonas sp.]
MAWALGALLIVWGGFVALGYRTGIHEADELTDGHLVSVAFLELAEDFNQSSAPTDFRGVPGLSSLKNHDYQRSMSVIIWDGQGKVLMRVGEAPPVDFNAKEGFEDLKLGSPAVAWRAFSRFDGPDHNRKVMVLLNRGERDELAKDIAEQVAEPGFWLLPVVALALGFAIHRGLRPLYALSRDVDALDIHKLVPLQGPYSQVELRAVVDSINTLAGRYQSAVEHERELASELAHELRTPLASLTLQAHALRQAVSKEEHERLLSQLEQDALRAGQVLSNLLALARASRTDLLEARHAVDLADIALNEVAEFGQLALESQHELSLESPGPFLVEGHAVLLGLVFRNLVENALSHTPPGTRVEVQLDSQARWLQVCDSAHCSDKAASSKNAPSGTGSRSLGLGTGLRVVEKIAAIHGASFGQVPPPPGFTNCYRLAFSPRSMDTATG